MCLNSSSVRNTANGLASFGKTIKNSIFSVYDVFDKMVLSLDDKKIWANSHVSMLVKPSYPPFVPSDIHAHKGI